MATRLSLDDVESLLPALPLEARKRSALAAANSRLADEVRTLPPVTPQQRAEADAYIASQVPGKVSLDDVDAMLSGEQAFARGDEAEFAPVRPTGGLMRRSRNIVPVEPEMAPLEGTAFGRGLKRGAQSIAAVRAAYGAGDPGPALDYIADVERRIAKTPAPASVTRFFQADGFKDSLKAFMDDPFTIAGSIMGESLGQTLPSLGAAGLAAGATGPLAPAAIIGGGSAMQEAGGKILESFAANGVDLTNPDQMRAALGNPALMNEIRNTAAAKGLAIGLIDALSVGLAGKLFRPSASATGRAVTRATGRAWAGRGAGAVAGAGAELGAQAGLGMVGEATGQVAAGEELNAPAILAEGIGELAGAPGEIATAVTSRRNVSRLSVDDVEQQIQTPSQARAEAPPVAAPPSGPTTTPGAETGTPATPAGPVQAPQGKARAFTPRGRAVDVQFELVEADTLVPSHRADLTPNSAFPAELQPRDRTRAASQEQIVGMAADLRPEMLGASPDVTTGAPIIGPDGVVESGNARVLAILRAHERNLSGAQAYRQWLESQGYDTGTMKNPVLVRRRTTQMTPEERIAFTREANERTAAGMSVSEQAQADAKAMPDALLEVYQGGDVTAAGNRDFVRRFIETVIPGSDRGTAYTAEGGLSQDGARRIENALYARAFDDAEGLAALREHPDTNFRAIGNAMVAVAPTWAKMRQQATAGTIPANLDITPALKEAVGLVRRARKEGKKLADLVAQRDLVAGDVTPEGRAILGIMFRDEGLTRPASGQRVAGALAYYTEQAMKAQPGPGLFGAQPVSALDILTLAGDRGQGGLFGAAAERMSVDDVDAMLPDFAESRQPSTQNMAGAGVNYVGAVRDSVQGATRAEPIRRETVLAKLAKDLGVPIYQGRIQSKKVLGFFRRPIEEVRIKEPGDIETAAHEYGHLLDHRFPEIRKQWTPASNANKTVRDELRGISYDASKLYEGYAEYMRLRLTQPAQAAAKAPTFHQWFEKFLDRNQYGPAIRSAEQGMTDYFGQDAISRARSKIGTPPAINEFLAPFWSRFRQNVSDDLHGIYRMERDMTGAIASAGPYEIARLTRGAHAIVEGSLLYGAPYVKQDGTHGFKGKGLQQILDPVSDNLDDVLLYFVGRSADELMRQGREKLFTKAEIQGMLSLRTNARETAFAEYQTWNRAVLDFAQAKGVINPGFRSKWQRTQYLPFHRVGQPGPHEAMPGAWSGIKALTGGSDNLRDILGNMVGNAAMLIQAGLTNEARLEVARLAKMPGGAKFMAEIPTEDRHVKLHRLEIERAILQALGVKDLRQLDPDRQAMVDEIVQGMSPMVWLTMKGQAPTGQDIVAALYKGKPHFFQVADPILYRSLVALNRPTKHWLTRLLALPKRLGQASITLTVDFISANIVRDTMMGFVMSRHGFKPVLDSARGMKSRITTDQNYRDFVANGGGFSSYLVDDEAFRTHLARFYQRKGINFESVLHTPAKVLLGIERIADAFEMATRLGEFQRAMKTGQNARHAAYSAREVSTDFGMRGDSATLGFLYDTIIFLKAGVNGVDRLYRGITHDPNRLTIAAKTAAIAGASMALYALNAGNPLYDDLEDWDRDVHWHIFIPTAGYYDFIKQNGREPRTAEEAGPLYVHMRLPKIWEIGAIASLSERALGQLINTEAGNYAEDAWRIVRDVFRFEYMPQAIAPMAEIAMNRSRFFDRPIETQSEKEMQPWARSGPYSSRTLKAYGENVARHMPDALPEWLRSPKQVEALLRGYLNTWAMYGLTLSDAAFFDDIPDLRLDQYPGLRRFYRDHPARNTKYVTQLYDAIDEAVKARRTMRFMDRTFRPELANELEQTAENLSYNQLQSAQRQMGAIRREMADVADAPTLRAVQQLVRERSQINRDIGLVNRLQRQGAWTDLGALKRWLKDDLTMERNRYARDVMRNVQPPVRDLGTGNILEGVQ